MSAPSPVPSQPPAHPYGPNTAAVRRFLQRLAALPAPQWALASEQYRDGQRAASFGLADDALALAIQETGRDDARRAVVGPTLRLAESVRADLVAGRTEAIADSTDADSLAESALAAILALIVRDALEREHFDTLYAPFQVLIAPESL